MYLAVVHRPITEVLLINTIVWVLAMSDGLAVTVVQQHRNEVASVAHTVATSAAYWERPDTVDGSKPVFQQCAASFAMLCDGHTQRRL